MMVISRVFSCISAEIDTGQIPPGRDTRDPSDTNDRQDPDKYLQKEYADSRVIGAQLPRRILSGMT